MLLTTVGGRAVAQVSLLGVFALRFDLGTDLAPIDAVWVSDPLSPTDSAQGTLGEVLVSRLGVEGEDPE